MAPKKTRVYLDVQVGNKDGGRMVFELFTDVTPRAAENFRGLCTGEFGQGQRTRKPLHFKGCKFFRVIRGFMCQSGDFVSDNGSGGESIYGGEFQDESKIRRHTQAGVLSMANNGPNSNGSQFFITFKAAKQLDGRHVVFGQLVDGIETLRLIEKIPVDAKDVPRVPIIIKDSGELSEETVEKFEGFVGVSSSSSAEGVVEGPSMQQGQAQKGGRGLLDMGEDESDDEEEDGANAGVGAAKEPFKNAREQKLFELRMKLNQGRRENNKEVIEEKRRERDPAYEKKAAQRAMEEARKRREEQEDPEEEAARKAVQIPEGQGYLQDSAMAISAQLDKEAKKEKRKGDFGWNVFNQDSLYRAHKKRISGLEVDKREYEKQKESLGGGADAPTTAISAHGFQPSEEAKDRLASEMEKQIAKKSTFSRRRMAVEDEDVSYINKRNEHFNKKLDRAFGDHTREIRQNLERGTKL
uniref:peptidylprolyl isomerase n=1 Tax=Chromera velia CCMP2878 TaxID=1169474 RepID=A0A0G4HEM6_9ALVE|eukprot:Cvel_26824.t1-p1 / transcript=Cvel_26824.t1 / gene=Cvel_26824 / organism=Chromera_velia_CCMP2878 / gene_product=Peptidyl-prolyl cis-trans isomerase, putative / transcript_product=Peptidyl-prolyl cis-trans isomerase, putative / location=Cvel_scaffold3249:13355-16912(+) / protein_length=467 / sequence_SO=supercontig / SO=protein_coding / is_pseudo=false